MDWETAYKTWWDKKTALPPRSTWEFARIAFQRGYEAGQATLQAENERLLKALRRQLAPWPDGLIVSEFEPEHVRGCRRLDAILRGFEERPACSQHCAGARAALAGEGD